MHIMLLLGGGKCILQYLGTIEFAIREGERICE